MAGEISAPLPGQPLVAAVLVGLSLVTLAVGTAVWSPWLAAVAALLAALGLVWSLGGGRMLRTVAPAFLLVLIIIPPPLGLDIWLTQGLRRLAVAGSSRLLDLLEVTHLRSGNLLEMPRQTLLVEEACSGINSVLIIMSCALFYGLWRGAAWPRVLLGFIAAPGYVLLGNLVRITLGGALKFRANIDILSGWKHELIGLLLFAAYLLLVISMDEWFVFLSSPMLRRNRAGRRGRGEVASSRLQVASSSCPDPGGSQDPSASIEPVTSNLQPATAPSAPPQARQPARLWGGSWARAAVYAFALLGLAQLGSGWMHYRPTTVKLPRATAQLAALVMPEQIGEWRRLSETPDLQKVETLGVYSQIWHYQKNQRTVSVALDYPFVGYHDVTLCYTLKGWTVLETHSATPTASQPRTDAGAGGPAAPRVEARMQDGLGLYGRLWFSTVDERGHWQGLPELERRFVERWKLSARPEPITYRIQALVTGYAPLPAAEEQSLGDLFEQARLLLWRQLSAQLSRP